MRPAVERFGRPLAGALLRERLAALRDSLRQGGLSPAALKEAIDGLPGWVLAEGQARTRSLLMPVVNATGVLLHTNLGRAPLPREAIRRIEEVASSYSTLEYEIGRGRRGSRAVHLDRLFALLFPGRASHVVNNNAAALLLALNTLAEGREVVVSRGELVEIGGSFRIPEVMAKSGAVLREVGTTNRTRLRDYERAVTAKTALLLKVHPSNYRIVGFTAEVPLPDLAALARRKRLPLLMDQGSGNLLDLRSRGVRGEPSVHDVLRDGADLVCCSGDKLLGGPQAGLLIGRPPLIARVRENPLARALRVDKMIYAALEAVLLSHVRGRAQEELPVGRMIALSRETIEARARGLVERLGPRAASRLGLRLREGVSLLGGGSAPEEGLPTMLIALRPEGRSPREVEARLRLGPVPVIARIESDSVLLDLRTVPEGQEPIVEAALGSLVEDAAADPRGAAGVRR
jgi:L-seryl-tRNA(Ser) seleniumtransferase